MSLQIINASWMAGEKVFSMLVTFSVGVLIANYLGVEAFGTYSYALSLIMLLTVASHAGLNGLVVHELLKFDSEKNIIMGTSFILKGLGSLLGLTFAIIYYFMFEFGTLPGSLILIFLPILLFQVFEVIDFWFQSGLQSKYVTYSRFISVLLGAMLKVGVLLVGGGLILLGLTQVIQLFLFAFFLVIFYQRYSHSSVFDWQYSSDKIRKYLKQGGLLFASAIFAMVYLKVDQIMLKWMGGLEQVGIYAVASTLSEAWNFLPVAIVASFFPKLVEMKKGGTDEYAVRMQQLFDFLFVVAFSASIFFTIFSKYLIGMLYSAEYAGASAILIIHIWSSIFVFHRTMISRWILMEELLMFSVLSQAFGAVSNVVLNYYFIPSYGGAGAAFATLISYSMASYFSLLFMSKTRHVFVMVTLSYIAPFRYLYKYFHKIWM